MELVPAIGLEIHAQLRTRSKMFCACPTAFGAPPNAQICPVCAGFPGVLPVVNASAVEMAVRFGLATGARVRERSVFARKLYFYPDLPKGYQVTQYETPICEGGAIEIGEEGPAGEAGGPAVVRLRRAHLEEDTGKSVHAPDGSATLVDLNRAGVPLLEIVTTPEITSPALARRTLDAIRMLVQYLGICDGNMEEGSLRCDANISLAAPGAPLGTRTEIKNLNSLRSLERSLAAEIERQRAVLLSGGAVAQETLTWDERRQAVASMRRKEESHDYRYFPDPDLPPLVVDASVVERARTGLPELPATRARRFREVHGIPGYDAWLLTSSRPLADYYEAVIAAGAAPKAASNLVMSEVLRAVNDRDLSVASFPVAPAALAELAAMLAEDAVSSPRARDIFQRMLDEGGMPRAIAAREGWLQLSDAGFLEGVVREVIAANPSAVAEYRAGKGKALQFLVGAAMKATRGKANPAMLSRMFTEALS